MKIEDILKKQGEIYKNLASNKTLQTCDKTTKKPPKPQLVSYRGYKISEQEYKAIKGLKKLIGGFSYRIEMNNNQITQLEIYSGLSYIPKQINNLLNLQTLSLGNNKITKLENLDNLLNLQTLSLGNNKITKLENLDNLLNLQKLWLRNNQITKLENLDNLPNLQVVWLYRNPIKNKFWPFSKNRKEIKKLRKKGIKVYI